MKSTIAVCVDSEIVEKAREARINISSAAEFGIATRLKLPIPEQNKKADFIAALVESLDAQTKKELKRGLNADLCNPKFVENVTKIKLPIASVLKLRKRLNDNP